MRVLVLGGTAWLGGHIVRYALDRGHEVTCLARGTSGAAPPGATFLGADRDRPGAYDAVAGARPGAWDAVVDLSWQPGQVRGAVQALAGSSGVWVYVSSCSVYAGHADPGAQEDADLLPVLEGGEAGAEDYGRAKVACEQLVLGGVGADRVVIARAGLIGGPGDASDRSGYWPWRFAHPAGPGAAVLVPDVPGLAAQLIDVRDLAAWLVHCAEHRVHGVFNAVGPSVPLGEHLSTARQVAGHTGDLVRVGPAWLVAHEVSYWAGQRSLPLWLPHPEYAGFSARDGSAARAAGLRTRSLEETLTDVLAWESARHAADPARPRRAGLSDADEADLIRLARA